jgi:hypothetical protein
MRELAYALIIALVLGIGINEPAVGATGPAQVGATSAQTAAPSAQQSMFAGDLKNFRDAYRSHRQGFAMVSDYSERVRTTWWTNLLAFAVFLFLTLPSNARGVRTFYRQMMETSPLPKEDGVTEESNRQARKVLFFYLLFLLYQIVQFPLTLGHDNNVQFTADLIIQSALVILVAWAFHLLKRDMQVQWKNDPARKEKMSRWLDQRLEGMRIRWRDIRKLAVGVFITGFAPAALAHMTSWLDAVTDFAQRLSGS